MTREYCEVWKDICGYEGLYQVSNMGRVRSVEHKVFNPHVLGDGQYRTVPSVVRKPNIMKGYHCVALCVDKKTKVFRIHRLVAEAFIGKQPSPEYQINHIDGDKANNCVDNLEWVTPRQNSQHAIRTGLRKPPSEETKRKIGARSKETWQSETYRAIQSEAATENWKLHHDERANAIKNGICKSTSDRYIRNRNGGVYDGK